MCLDGARLVELDLRALSIELLRGAKPGAPHLGFCRVAGSEHVRRDNAR